MSQRGGDGGREFGTRIAKNNASSESYARKCVSRSFGHERDTHGHESKNETCGTRIRKRLGRGAEMIDLEIKKMPDGKLLARRLDGQPLTDGDRTAARRLAD